MSDDKSFYVRIKEPANVRRNLLGCSKDIIFILKNYDRIDDLREEKLKHITELAKIIRQIKKLNSHLSSKIPIDKIKSDETTVDKKKTIKHAKKQDSKKLPKDKKHARLLKEKIGKVNSAKKSGNKEIQELENELSDIENKLSKMGI